MEAPPESAIPSPSAAGQSPPSPLEGALALIGDRWSLQIIKLLLGGPRRFSSLSRAIPGISANILTQRLRRLEQHGAVLRRGQAETVEAPVYDLSAWGRGLETAIVELERWMARASHDLHAERTGKGTYPTG